MLMKAVLDTMRQFVRPHHPLTPTWSSASKMMMLIAMLALGLPLAALAQAPDWVDFQAASGVLGQANFTTGNFGTTDSTFGGPSEAVVDPTTGKLFVSEAGNSRVLRFASAAALTNGAAAEAVLGQADFTSNGPACTATGMNGTVGVFVDGAGRLWVGDALNNRVLRFDNAASKANGASADGVLGQPDFTTCTVGATQAKMNFANAVYIDNAGRLWVSEPYNNRVLRFDNVASKANGANADGVLGQANFTSNTPATTATGMKGPYQVMSDSAGRLWVSDNVNRRVLRFDNAASKPNGASADGVLGQANFTSNTLATTATGMNWPGGVTLDSVGRLYVSDALNNRILIFNNAATLGNGAAANHVLGQPDFTSNTANNGGLSAQSLWAPWFISFDTSNNLLWVTDFANSRVLRYQAPPVPKQAAVGGVAQQFELAPAATGYQWGLIALSGLLLAGAGLLAWRKA